MAERFRAAMALILLAAPLGACGGETAAPANDAAAPAGNAAAPSDPVSAAQALVRREVGGNVEIRFGEARQYKRGSVDVVCGSFSAPPRGDDQRYITVSGTDVVWLEEETREVMDRLSERYCQDSANA